MPHDLFMGSDPQWVAIELTRFALPAAVARPRPGLLDPTVRAAVLIDLALAGALTDTEDGLEVDTSPTGFAPADRLLDAVTDKPDKPLAWWLYRAPITIHDIAHVLIAHGDWDRHGPLRHYRDLRPERTASQRHNLDTALRRHGTPAQDATATLLNLLPLPGHRRGPGAGHPHDHYGSASWLVPDLEANLQRRGAILHAAAQDAHTALSSNFIF